MSVPTSDEIAQLLRRLQDKRKILLSLARDRPVGETDDLVAAIDEIGAQLLVADEELRVQNEQLAMSSRRLDLLAAADEELFANAPSAYVQTDQDGLIVRYNHSARRLLGLSERSSRSRTIVNLVVPGDRSAMRSFITTARAGTADGRAPLEATLQRPDGSTSPVVFTLRRSGSANVVLHWELHDFGTDAHGGPSAPAQSVARPLALTAIASAAQEFARQETPGMTMQQVVLRARDAVPGCDEAGLILVKGHRRVASPGSAQQFADRCDQIELEVGEGPCVEALDTNSLVRADRVTIEARWPAFAARALELGLGSVLAVPMEAPRGVLGALNLYATMPGAFDGDAELIGATYASHAAIAIMHADLEANLRVGLSTREEIGRAVGILMERHRVTATAAFDMLVYASQRTHRKLRYVALWVNETGEDPDALIR